MEWGVTLLGRATVVEDVDRIAEANRWVYDAYEQHETDGSGGEEPGSGTDGDADPGEPGVDDALLEIDVGSATLQEYE